LNFTRGYTFSFVFFLQFLLTSFLLISTKYLINLFMFSAFFWGVIFCTPCLPSTVIKDVVKVFVIYVHATLSNGCVVHAFISMETNTRWKIAMCDVRNFLVRSNIGRKRDNNIKSNTRKEVHHNINSNYIPCIILLITVIFGRWFLVRWTSRNLFVI
jgi:hypothetical protein